MNGFLIWSRINHCNTWLCHLIISNRGFRIVFKRNLYNFLALKCKLHQLYMLCILQLWCTPLHGTQYIRKTLNRVSRNKLFYIISNKLPQVSRKKNAPVTHGETHTLHILFLDILEILLTLLFGILLFSVQTALLNQCEIPCIMSWRGQTKNAWGRGFIQKRVAPSPKQAKWRTVRQLAWGKW